MPHAATLIRTSRLRGLGVLIVSICMPLAGSRSTAAFIVSGIASDIFPPLDSDTSHCRSTGLCFPDRTSILSSFVTFVNGIERTNYRLPRESTDPLFGGHTKRRARAEANRPLAHRLILTELSQLSSFRTSHVPALTAFQISSSVGIAVEHSRRAATIAPAPLQP